MIFRISRGRAIATFFNIYDYSNYKIGEYFKDDLNEIKIIVIVYQGNYLSEQIPELPLRQKEKNFWDMQSP